MKAFLLYVSFLLTVSVCSAASQKPFFPAEEGQRSEYAVTLEFRQMHFTGISIMKKADSVLVGSLLNEFGIRAFDFHYDPVRRRVKLENMTSFIDRWYIRKILRRDLTILFSNDGSLSPFVVHRRRIEVPETSVLVLTNMKYQVRYRFSQLND